MTNPDSAAQFAAFQAWQDAQKSAPPLDEVVKPTIADVLCALIRSANLPTQAVAEAYDAVVREHFAVTVAPTTSIEPAPVEPAPVEPVA